MFQLAPGCIKKTPSNTTGTTFNEDASKEDDDSEDSDKGDKGDEGDNSDDSEEGDDSDSHGVVKETIHVLRQLVKKGRLLSSHAHPKQKKRPRKLVKPHCEEKPTSTTKRSNYSPVIATQTDTPNVYLVSEGNVEQPIPALLIQDDDVTVEEIDNHKSLFYAQLQLYYSTNNQRKLMGRDQLNSIINVVNGDVTFTKGNAKQTTLHYKYKKDSAVLSFGEHFSLVKAKDIK